MNHTEAMLNQLIPLIREKTQAAPRVIVALDGRCAAGKSTLGEALAERLNAALIHMDDFFLRPAQRTPERLATPGENIDHERFLSEVLIPLRENTPCSDRPFSCMQGELGDPVSVPQKPITIVEGSYACHPALRDHYDLRVFLTVDPEEQMRRLKARNGAYAEVFRTTWIPLEEAYFSACGVEACCDITLKSECAEGIEGISK